MEIEYQRWIMINTILNVYPKSYEYKNIIERLFLNMSNIKNKNSTIVCKRVSINNQIVKTAIKESLEKQLFSTEEEAVVHFKHVINQINTFIKNKKSFKKLFIVIINKNIVQYKNFSEKIPKNRIKILKNILSIKNIKNINTKIGRMLLRYMSIGIGGQQWNMPFANYKYLNDKYNISIEGFASPLNSQLIKISPYKKYCSIFYDTDHWFGSIGDFFDLNVHNISMCVNPPYIETIMIKTILKFLKLIKNNVRIFTIMPYWKDSVIIKAIKEYSVYYEILEKNKHYYENSINNKIIIAKFPSIIAVFEKNKSDNYKDIAKHMKC